VGAPDRSIVWAPQPGPQTELLRWGVFETFYGGARGGGKTDGVLGEWVQHANIYGTAANGLMVRRQRTELYDTIERSRQLYTLIGAKFNETEKLWRFPNGARLRFAYLENDSDAEMYQGHSYTRLYVEEVGNFPSPAPIMKLIATLRSAGGVPCRMIATGNPGGPGHQWVKARYIDPAPQGRVILMDERTGLERCYIPARVSDNKALIESDPSYIGRLKAAGSPELVRAWLEGDWTVIAGAFFAEFSMARHVVTPSQIPEHWQRFRACDWGSARPFSVGWYAVSEGDLDQFPRGALIKYREWYGMKPGEPNVGLKMTAEEVAEGILERDDKGYEFKWPHSVIDPAAFARDGGPSIAERMAVHTKGKVVWREADNKRVGKLGAIGGWDQMRARLKGDEDGRAMLYLFSTCAHTIRTLPALQHDEGRLEDVDTDGEDHAPDETRYACMSRPYLRKAPRPDLEPDEALQAFQKEQLRIGSLREQHFNARRQKREDMRT